MTDIQYTVGETAITVSFLGPQGPGVPAGGTTGQALVKSSSDDYDTEWAASAAPVASVNGETGVVVLDAADVGAAATSHSHSLSDVTDSGGAAALEVGTTAGTVAAGDHAHTGVYATAAQGSTADSAVQPGDLATVATTGAYSDLSGTPTLGTAAATAATDYATAAQGSTADSAVQPGDLATVATTGAYSDLSGTPTLGTAAAAATGDFATAAQGSTADSAVQPGDDADTLGSGVASDGQVLTADGAGNAAWETPASGVTDHGLLSGLADDDHSQYALADGTRGTFQAVLAEGQFVDGDKSKLDGIETAADVTDATNVDAAGATMNTDTDVSGNSWVLDEDTMSSNSATKVPTQQSVKAYADNTFATISHSHSLMPAFTTNAQTGTTYTLVLADAGKLVTLSNASPITATVPPNSSVAFPTGTRIALLQLGAGQVTVAEGSGVTVNTAETLKLADQYAAAELVKTATDTWVLFGRLEAA